MHRALICCRRAIAAYTSKKKESFGRCRYLRLQDHNDQNLKRRITNENQSMPWFVYILRSEKDGKRYFGCTQDLNERLETVNATFPSFPSTRLVSSRNLRSRFVLMIRRISIQGSVCSGGLPLTPFPKQNSRRAVLRFGEAILSLAGPCFSQD